jgi:hypothetical protein
VSRRARIRAAAAASVALVIGLLLASGVVPNTFSLWEAEASNAGSVYGGGWIPAPGGANPTTVGGATNSTVTLSWTTVGVNASEPHPNPVTGQQLQIADGGSGASASCGTYANEGSTLTATASSTTDSGGSVPAADWWCYQVISTSATSWTSIPLTLSAARLLVPTSVVLHNGGTSNLLDSGDTITITFNQNVTGIPASLSVCQQKNTQGIFIGDSTCKNPSDAYSIGLLKGISGGASVGAVSASASVSGAVVTVTITGTGLPTSGSGGTLTASTSITTTGGLGACNSASSPTCTGVASGSF